MNTKPTKAAVIEAIKRRTRCAHVNVFSWHDDRGRLRVEAHVTSDDWPDEGTTWRVLAVAGSLGELLRIVAHPASVSTSTILIVGAVTYFGSYLAAARLPDSA